MSHLALTCVLFARGHHKADPAVAALGFIVMVVVIIIVFVRELGASYDVFNRGGVPYCGRCRRQVSYRRNHCRSCGYQFKQYWAPSPSYPPPNCAPSTPRPHQPFVDPWVKDLFRGLWGVAVAIASGCFRAAMWTGRKAIAFAACDWLESLPSWGQPIAWGLMAVGIILGPLFCVIFAGSPAVSLASALWAALGLSFAASMFRAWLKGRSAGSWASLATLAEFRVLSHTRKPTASGAFFDVTLEIENATPDELKKVWAKVTFRDLGRNAIASESIYFGDILPSQSRAASAIARFDPRICDHDFELTGHSVSGLVTCSYPNP